MKRHGILLIVLISFTLLGFIDFAMTEVVFIVNDTQYYMFIKSDFSILLPPHGRLGGYYMGDVDDAVRETLLRNLYIIKDPERRPSEVISLSELLDKKSMEELADALIEDTKRRVESHGYGYERVYRIYLSQIIERIGDAIR